jgi:hypothetical protein
MGHEVVAAARYRGEQRRRGVWGSKQSVVGWQEKEWNVGQRGEKRTATKNIEKMHAEMKMVSMTTMATEMLMRREMMAGNSKWFVANG